MNTLQPLPIDRNQYVPGVCNIGPAEIRQRRRFGHVGLIVTVVLFVALVFIHAPAIARLLLIVPAGASATGYLQAYFHFCAGFGSRGVFNFGDAVGDVTVVDDAGARARDRRRSLEIGLASLAIGLVVGVVAALLPI